MKAALTVWNGRISPVFDVSREALLVTIEDGAVVARSHENLETSDPSRKLHRLTELGVETLICGAISAPLHRELAARGVSVIGFVAGEVNEVLQAFLTQSLPHPALTMPGCGGSAGRLRGGRGRGGGGGRSRGWRAKGHG